MIDISCPLSIRPFFGASERANDAELNIHGIEAQGLYAYSTVQLYVIDKAALVAIDLTAIPLMAVVPKNLVKVKCCLLI